MQVVSPLLPFAPISWWATVYAANSVVFDPLEAYTKMTYRNRYRIVGANNPILLSIPLEKGRNQRTPMATIAICNKEKWQIRHWRTLVSVYRRTPFWEHYEHFLEPMYTTPYHLLPEFNDASFQLLKKLLKWTGDTVVLGNANSELAVEHCDLRRNREYTLSDHASFPKYYQIFEDRQGFQADLSILDLLFSEGPQAASWLNNYFKNA